MLAYDAYLALFAAFFVLSNALEIDRWKLIVLATAMFLPSLVVPHLLRTAAMHGSYELLLILIALAVGLSRLLKRAQADASDTRSTVVNSLLLLKKSNAPKEIHAKAAVALVSGVRIKRYRNE